MRKGILERAALWTPGRHSPSTPSDQDLLLRDENGGGRPVSLTEGELKK